MSPARLPNDDELRFPRFRKLVTEEEGVDSQPPLVPVDPSREGGPASDAKVAGPPKEEEK